MRADRRISDAVALIGRFGSIEGAHHKQWVLDQVLRVLLGGPGYEAWLEEANSDPDYGEWDQGVAP